MVREGIEKLLNITDRSYNVFTISTSHIARMLYNSCMQCQQLVYFLNSLKRKIEHVYFSRLDRQRLSLSLSEKMN